MMRFLSWLFQPYSSSLVQLVNKKSDLLMQLDKEVLDIVSSLARGGHTCPIPKGVHRIPPKEVKPVVTPISFTKLLQRFKESFRSDSFKQSLQQCDRDSSPPADTDASSDEDEGFGTAVTSAECQCGLKFEKLREVLANGNGPPLGLVFDRKRLSGITAISATNTYRVAAVMLKQQDCPGFTALCKPRSVQNDLNILNCGAFNHLQQSSKPNTINNQIRNSISNKKRKRDVLTKRNDDLDDGLVPDAKRVKLNVVIDEVMKDL